MSNSFQVLFDTCSSILTGAEHVMFRREAAKSGIPPRYIWVPLRHEYTTEGMISGRIPPSSGGNWEHPIRQRVQSIDVMCWGLNPTQCEEMESDLLVVIHRETPFVARLKGAEWMVEGFATQGMVLTVSFDVFTPVFSSVYGTTTKVRPTSVAFTQQVSDVDGDGVLVAPNK